jgi:hypothetical protein
MDLAQQLHGLNIATVIWKYKKPKESRSSNPKLKPRISTIRKDFHYYQHPRVLKYFKFYFYATLEK